MKTIITPWPRVVRAVRAAFLANFALCLTPCLRADPDRQRVSFDASYSELVAAESKVEVRLTRCAVTQEIYEPLSVALKVRPLTGAGAWTVSGVYFAAGSRSAVCTVRVVEGAVAGMESVLSLEIEDSAEVESFARKGHCIRRKVAAAAVPGPVIHAVIFSGAESPENAVEAGAHGALVIGGIVALGGTPMAPVLSPVRLTPQLEYAAGVWTPPLWPSAVLLQWGEWKSNIAP
jgi:hypothetical protein